MRAIGELSRPTFFPGDLAAAPRVTPAPAAISYPTPTPEPPLPAASPRRPPEPPREEWQSQIQRGLARQFAASERDAPPESWQSQIERSTSPDLIQMVPPARPSVPQPEPARPSVPQPERSRPSVPQPEPAWPSVPQPERSRPSVPRLDRPRFIESPAVLVRAEGTPWWRWVVLLGVAVVCLGAGWFWWSTGQAPRP
jgi:hypothetical protein